MKTIKTQFTPKPWTVEDGRIYGIEPSSGEEVLICDMSPDVSDNMRPALTELDEANAYLISAAPDAHALLIEMATVINKGGDFQLGPKGKHHDLKARLVAYFAKASGVTQ